MSLIRGIQIDITNVIKKDYVKTVLKKEKNETTTDNDNSEDDDHEMDTISRKQLRRF